MKYRLTNARIWSSDRKDVLKGDVLVADGVIVGVGTTDESFVADRTVDFENDLLIPGFVNAHAHSAMTVFRSIADDLSLQDWLYTRIFPLEEKLTAKLVYYGTYLSILEMVRSGITTCGDMYFFPEEAQKAYDSAGFRARLILATSDAASNPKTAMERAVATFDQLEEKSALATPMAGLHAEYTCSEPLLCAMCDFALSKDLPFQIHMSETLTEVGECVSRHGMTPPMFFHKLGIFDIEHCSVAHAVHLDKEDVALMAECGVFPVHNPSSNLKLASGIAPIHSMLNKGIPVALGTDGAASNNSLNFFKEMFLATALQKCVLHDAAIVSAEEVLKMATENGARALGYSDVGLVKEGYRADLVRINTRLPNFLPDHNAVKNLVYSANPENVKMTMIDGKIVYENGVYHTGKSLEEVSAKLGEILNF